jgi:hypothetical protein
VHVFVGQSQSPISVQSPPVELSRIRVRREHDVIVEAVLVLVQGDRRWQAADRDHGRLRIPDGLDDHRDDLGHRIQ